MTPFAMNSEVCHLSTDEEPALASFTRHLFEIAAVSKAGGSKASPAAVLNAMRLPAIVVDRHGFAVEMNCAAEVIFDDNIKIKDRRLFIRDLGSRTFIKEAIEKMASAAYPAEPVVVPRVGKLPMIVRIWPLEGAPPPPVQDKLALLTINALGPRPGPPAAIIAKTFCLTPSEARLASIIARGASPHIAARELKISRETARNQLKSVFAKTETHRQSELVALLMQVE